MPSLAKDSKYSPFAMVVLIFLLFFGASTFFIYTGEIPASRGEPPILKSESPLSFWLHIVAANSVWVFAVWRYRYLAKHRP